MKRKGNTTQLQVSIPKELLTDLKGLAKKENRSTSNLVSHLLSGEMKEKAITIKEIPEDVHYKFKLACAKNRVEMKAAIIDYMKAYGDKWGAK